jgi:hypothetical protein
LLAELPDDVSDASNAQKLASEIADQLRAAIAMNPLLESIGESLDPKTLFEGPSGKTRVSVINLAGLASEEARDSFVNRLQMSLFTFIKRNPNPTGCLYVIDEAQNFAPSGAGTACKASALSLAAQARKYGLGMMFATQTPKGVDNKIVSNCTTHVYGRMGAWIGPPSYGPGNAISGGPSALSRLERDVIALPGNATVIWLEGINDFGTAKAAAEGVIDGVREGVKQLRARIPGVRIVMATLTSSIFMPRSHLSPAMKSRRRIAHPPEPLYGQPIAV